jgi:uncharacterized membrane protein
MYRIWVKYFERLRASYWFLPSLLVLGAILTSLATVSLDLRVGEDWLDWFDQLEVNKPEGARSLLSAVATSSITVAGVVFSITITSVSLASQQFGPRLLTNFMRDRSNQFVLGTFLATFIYSLLVLRTIHDGEPHFVPQISIIATLLLSLASVGVLIYYIHHIADSLRVTTVTARIGEDIERTLSSLFPGSLGEDPEAVLDGKAREHIPDDFDAEAQCVPSNQTGYIQGIDTQGILELAKRHNLLLEVLHRPGGFVFEGEPLARLWPSASLTPRLLRQLNRSIVTDRQRSPRQDLLFLINELVEILARALSSGINDPFTAINCIDRLGAACKQLLREPFPSRYRFDRHGRLRVIVAAMTFADFAEAAFGQIRPYAITDPNVCRHLLTMLAELVAQTDAEDKRAVLVEHARLIHGGAMANHDRVEDRHKFDGLMSDLLAQAALRRAHSGS